MGRYTTFAAAPVGGLMRSAGVPGVIGGIALAAAYVAHPPSAPPETVPI